MPVVLAVAVLLGVVVAPTASASTAQLVATPSFCKPVLPEDPCGPPDTTLVYQGGGERNRVTLAQDGGGAIRISDAGAMIEPGLGCSRVDEHRVVCSVPTSTGLQSIFFVAAGGGSDTVRSELDVQRSDGNPGVLGVAIDGGPGNDVLLGGPGPDQLYGGGGADRLQGRGGDDELHDASLRDFLPSADRIDSGFPPPVLLPPGRSPDSYDGGTGTDTVDYLGRAAKLRINLASTKPAAGARGERDSIRRVENASGGDGDDRLAGNKDANQLDGTRGDDLLVGRGGDDLLRSGEGKDVIRGGRGDDAINQEGASEGTGGDRMSCGSGDDVVGTALPRDFLVDDCEQISPGIPSDLKANFGLRSLLPLRAGREPRVLSGNLECFTGLVCQVRAELRVRGRASRRGTAPRRGTLLGSQTFTATGPGPGLAGVPAEQKTIDLRLSSGGFRLLRRHRALHVRVIIASQYTGAEPPGYVTLLRAP